MREVFDPWPFVVASYVIGIGATMILVLWSWYSMRREEKRRDDVRKR